MSLHPFSALVLRSVTYPTLQLQVPHAQRTRYGLSCNLQNPASRCLAETTCTGEEAQRRKEMIMVTDFKGFLSQREKAYKWTKLMSDSTSNGSRCIVENDRELVEKRILESGFAYGHDFDVYVKKVVDKTLEPWRQLGRRAGGLRLAYTFEASKGDENKCGKCDKLKEHHHTKKRDGTISEREWCYDFLLDL